MSKVSPGIHRAPAMGVTGRVAAGCARRVATARPAVGLEAVWERPDATLAARRCGHLVLPERPAARTDLGSEEGWGMVDWSTTDGRPALSV